LCGGALQGGVGSIVQGSGTRHKTGDSGGDARTEGGGAAGLAREDLGRGREADRVPGLGEKTERGRTWVGRGPVEVGAT